MVAWSNVFGL